jgi:hypothetical protein
LKTISTKTVTHEHHRSNICGRAAIAKPLITESIAQMHKQWCHNHKPRHNTTGNARLIWSDELSFTLFPTSGKVYIWRTPKEAYNPEYLVPTAKWGGGGSFCVGLGSNIMVQYSAGPIITLQGRITAKEYVDKLGNQVHPMIQTLFSNNDAVFQDIYAPILHSWNCSVMV